MITSRKRIFVTSDWHLGGTPDTGKSVGTQICRSVHALAAFIEWVREQARSGDLPVELIINGDVVDFLAPDDRFAPKIWLGDQALAIDRLNQIVTSSPGPFHALRNFLATKNCSLTLLSGNHDLELSLPVVRRHFCETILHSDGRRLEFLIDGEACVRGKLLVEHGNRYDPLNAVDHSRLRQERSHLSRGLKLPEDERDESFFQPPYGTQLVIEVFNPLLAECPFLNLLKPEETVALPLVLALYPKWLPLLREAHRYFQIKKERHVNRLRRPAQPADPGLLAPGPKDSGYNKFDDYLREKIGSEVENFLRGEPPDPLADHQVARISYRDKVASLRRRMAEFAVRTREVLHAAGRRNHAWVDGHRASLARLALRKASDDRTFSLVHEDPGYLNAAQQLAEEGGWEVVVFGHTHLAKSISLPNGARYLNSGTWADVMRVPKTITGGGDGSGKELDEFLAVLASREVAKYLRRRLTFVEAELREDGSVRFADLRLWDPATNSRQPYEEDCDP